jgi:hypothetical protein
MSIAAYFPPGTWWNWMADSYPATRIIIANNQAGPGSTQEMTLLNGIHQMKQAGIRVFGYVFTSSGRRNPAAIKSDVDRWRDFYNVTDIMFDEGLAMMKNFSFYKDIADYVHTKTPGSLVELNPGAPVLYGEPINEAYMKIVDILSLYEGSYANYSNFHPPAWITKYPAVRFKNYIYGVPDPGAIPGLLQQVLQNHIGYFDITDTDPSHIWGVLASDLFWNTFVAAIKAVCK